MTSLTGSDANTLAILTMLLGNKKAEDIALSKLNGLALKIAKRLIDNRYRCSNEVKETVKKFIDWKNGLGL